MHILLLDAKKYLIFKKKNSFNKLTQKKCWIEKCNCLNLTYLKHIDDKFIIITTFQKKKKLERIKNFKSP